MYVCVCVCVCVCGGVILPAVAPPFPLQTPISCSRDLGPSVMAWALWAWPHSGLGTRSWVREAAPSGSPPSFGVQSLCAHEARAGVDAIGERRPEARGGVGWWSRHPGHGAPWAP